MKQLAPHAGNESFSARIDFIQKEPDAIRGLLRAYYQAVNYIARNPDYTTSLFTKMYNVDKAIAAAYYADTIGQLSRDGQFSIEGLEFMMKAATSLKLIPVPIPLDRVITREFVPVHV
jgi:ABC-type nitrate/sulfonate/bicarbonate transport system substrate-binding protein